MSGMLCRSMSFFGSLIYYRLFEFMSLEDMVQQGNGHAEELCSVRLLLGARSARAARARRARRREIGHCACCAGLNVFVLLRLLTFRVLHVLVLRPRASLMGGSLRRNGSSAASTMPWSRLSSDVFLVSTGLGLVLGGSC